MKPLKERPWIGTHRGKGGEGDLNRCGKDWSTMRHQKKGRVGAKFRGWPEIGPDGDVLLVPYVPQRITGIDDDDDESWHLLTGTEASHRHLQSM
jgi:hypothetical protein